MDGHKFKFCKRKGGGLPYRDSLVPSKYCAMRLKGTLDYINCTPVPLIYIKYIGVPDERESEIFK